MVAPSGATTRWLLMVRVMVMYVLSDKRAQTPDRGRPRMGSSPQVSQLSQLGFRILSKVESNRLLMIENDVLDV